MRLHTAISVCMAIKAVGTSAALLRDDVVHDMDETLPNPSLNEKNSAQVVHYRHAELFEH